MTQGYVNLAINNHIATITFYHPSSNALPSYLLEQLVSTFQSASQDKSVRTIILQSEGRTFCAGASFDELLALKDHETAVQFFMGFANVINIMRQVPQFVIVKVQGKAVGGGVGLIAAADYAMATDKAAIKLSELSIGLGPYVIAPVIKRKIGVAAFSELSINATSWHTAFWAREKSLYAKIWPSQTELGDAVETLAAKLSEYDPLATALLKKELWDGTEHWSTLLAEKAQISARLVLQDFAKAFLNKFKNKEN